jgi:hypothetical protein
MPLRRQRGFEWLTTKVSMVLPSETAHLMRVMAAEKGVSVAQLVDDMVHRAKLVGTPGTQYLNRKARPFYIQAVYDSPGGVLFPIAHKENRPRRTGGVTEWRSHPLAGLLLTPPSTVVPIPGDGKPSHP